MSTDSISLNATNNAKNSNDYINNCECYDEYYDVNDQDVYNKYENMSLSTLPVVNSNNVTGNSSNGYPVTTRMIYNDPDSIFPYYLRLNFDDNLATKINNLVNPYKSEVTEAIIYSVNENKNIKSDKRNSLKSSFEDPDLKKCILENVIELIKLKLHNDDNKDIQYSVSIGDQQFDYVKYENGGFFERHSDFVRVNNDNQCQYTLLIGLSDKSCHSQSGSTAVWLPITPSNKNQYDEILAKYNVNNPQGLLCYHDNCNYDYVKLDHLIDNNSQPIGIPHFFTTFRQGDALLFKSELYHSGEIFKAYNKVSVKELLSIVINVTSFQNMTNNTMSKQNEIDAWLNDSTNKCIMFDMFENWMYDFAKQNNLLPFQIILNTGVYGGMRFENIYVKYFNMDNDICSTNNTNLSTKIEQVLKEVYNKTKLSIISNNIAHNSEVIIKEDVLDDTSNNFIDNFVNKTNNENFEIFSFENIDEIKIICENYANNCMKKNNQLISHVEKTLNSVVTTEMCNEAGEYDTEETKYATYLNCKVDIKFCFCKVTKK